MSAETMGPLSGITVVDLTRQLAGPMCTRVLADLGATVIKVEQDGSKGDMMAPTPAIFSFIIKNKERVTLDLREPRGKADLDSLLDKADVLVENFQPGVMEAMGPMHPFLALTVGHRARFGWDRVRQRWPRLIMCSVSGFGQTGPDSRRPAMDVVIQAMSGFMSCTGFEDKPPVGSGILVADVTSGLYAAIGVLGALAGRGKTGKGAYVDIAMLDSLVSLMGTTLVRSLNGIRGYENGTQPPRAGSSSSTAAPFDTYKCKDGYIALVGLQPHFYKAICEVVGRPGMQADADPRFRTTRTRAAHYDVFKPMLEEALSHRSVDEWMTRFRTAGVPCGKVNTFAEALQEPQLRARGMISDVHGSGKFKGLKTLGSPVNISGYAQQQPWCVESNAHAAKHGIGALKARL